MRRAQEKGSDKIRMKLINRQKLDIYKKQREWEVIVRVALLTCHSCFLNVLLFVSFDAAKVPPRVWTE